MQKIAFNNCWQIKSRYLFVLLDLIEMWMLACSNRRLTDDDAQQSSQLVSKVRGQIGLDGRVSKHPPATGH